MTTRWFDVAGATGGLVFFSPVMAAIAAAIWWEDRGPALFRQQRLGLGRCPFEILKFRSMRDNRVTRVGRVLRATGLDELPQFINILCGDMSAVGPRPLTADDVTRLGWTTAGADFRWTRRPGLTGLAQLAGPDSAAASLVLDRRYIERQSLWLDVNLIALSFAVNVCGKARVRALVAGSRLAADVRPRD